MIQRTEKTIRITTRPTKMSTVIVPIRSCSVFRLGVGVGGSSTATMVIVAEGDAVGEGDADADGVGDGDAVGIGDTVGEDVVVGVALPVGVGVTVGAIVGVRARVPVGEGIVVPIPGSVTVVVPVCAGVCVTGGCTVGVDPCAMLAAGAENWRKRASAPASATHQAASPNDVCR
jgi:hypothetical protein